MWRRGAVGSSETWGEASARLVRIFCALVALALGLSSGAYTTLAANSGNGAGQLQFTEAAGARQVIITLHKSRTLKFDKPFGTATVGATSVIDALPINNHTLYLQGKKIGTTNLTLFTPGSQLMGVIDVEVVPEVGDLQRKVRDTSGDRGIHVSSAGGEIVLSGTARDAVSADKAMTIAKGMAARQGASVVNAMQVAPPQQVMLEVRFLEASRSGARDLGVSLRGTNKSNGGGALVGAGVPAGGIPLTQTAGQLIGGGTPYLTVLGNLLNTHNANVDVFIQALETKGLLRQLASPNLSALSGQTASFLAGGEYPIPIATSTAGGFPTVSVEFKKYGIQLNFTPTVLSHGIINLKVEPTVSQLDYANAVTLAGTQVPGLTTRTAQTTVQLRDGQSFALAGLLSSLSSRNLSQVPWIGSVPVLGALFRSAAYQQNQTDLVIIVTPHLAQPAVPGEKLATPLDKRLPANDVDLFLNGQPDVKKRFTKFVMSGGRVHGPYGHILKPDVGITGPVAKP